MRKINWATIIFILGIIGPGIITANVDNDAGGITTYAMVGAQFGYSMLWSLIPVTLLLILVQEMCARMGAVTGKGLADLIRENFGIKWTLFIMIGLVLANVFVTIAEFAGIAAIGEIIGLNRYILIPLVTFFILFVTIRLNYKSLEKFFLLLSFFYIAYVISGFMSKPHWGEVMHQFVWPEIHWNKTYLLYLIGLIGTTITPWMQFYLQSSIVEKGIKPKDYAISKWDVIVGCIITDVVSFFIIVACAATIFAAGIQVNSVVDAAISLEPIAGKFATLLFSFGFFCAALFGAFILPISTSFYVCEALGLESGVNKRFRDAKTFYLTIFGMLLVSAAVILLPNIPLIGIMVAAQVINGLLIPFILIIILLLINNKKVMGEYVNKPWQNFVAWAGSVLIIIVSVMLLITSFV